MINFINNISSIWLEKFIIGNIQNSIFIVILFAIFIIFKNRNASLMRIIAFIGILKLMFPIFKTPFTNSINLLYQLPVIEITQNSIANSEPNIYPNIASFLMIFWFLAALFLIFISISNTFKLKKSLELLTPLNHKNNIFISSKNHSPMVIGFWKPIIIVPNNFTKLSAKFQNLILNHENTHLSQYDPLLKMIANISLAFNFANPLAWLLYFKLNEYIEMSCDDIVSENLKLNQKEISNNLLDSAIVFGSSFNNLQTALSFSTTNNKLKNRITYQLNKKERKMKNSLRRIILLCMTLIAVLFCFQCYGQNNITGSSLPEEMEDLAQNIETTQTNVPFLEESNESIKDNIPQLENKVDVSYPEESRKNNESGLVEVEVTIDKNGKVISANIIKSAGENLDKSALGAAMKMKFEPQNSTNNVEETKFTIPFNFKLSE